MNIFLATIDSNSAVLNMQESWHCCKVLRKKIGDVATVIDGKGLKAEGVLDFVSEKKCTVALTSTPVLEKKKNFKIHLAIAPTKQIDRIEWMIEKCVEFGIDELSFIQCKNSERTKINSERFNSIVLSAVKQSLQAYLPKVNELLSFEKFVESKKEEQNFIAHCNDSKNKKDLININFKNKSSLILIGPEGDFSPKEIEMAIEKNFTEISLGSNRLRSETAGLYVCQAIGLINELE